MTHWFSVLAAAVAVSASPALATTYFVDDDAPPGGDGLSWATAFDSIDDAFPLDDHPDIAEVRVAQGTYIPDNTSGGGEGHFFLLFKTYIGGYAGIGAPDPDARDPKAYPSILSGDVNQDDTNDFQNTDDNRVRVFRLVNAEMDGFVVTGTRAASNYGTSGIPYASNIVAGLNFVVRDCHFRHNSAARGGAFALSGEYNGLIEDCTFEHNRAVFIDEDSTRTGAGGAVSVYRDRHTTFLNCRFSHNRAIMGGAVSELFDGTNDTNFANCIFTANVASSETYGAAGGAVAWLSSFDDVSFTHCLFYANEATNGIGGGVFASATVSQYNNCILWANRDSSGRSFAAQVAFGIRDQPHTSDHRNLTNLVEGSPSPEPMAEPVTLGFEPRFIDPLGPDGLLGTDDDDFRPAFGSPAIDAGVTDTPHVHPPITVDFLGRPRSVDDPATPDVAYPSFFGLPDIGPYEYQEDCDDSGTVDSVELDDGTLADCDSNGVPDVCQAFVDCNANLIADYCDIASGFDPDCNANGIPDSCDILMGTSLDANDNDIPDECEAAVIFVDAANTARSGDGTSWPTAFSELRDALDAARARPNGGTEIWVAAGTYHPAPPGGPITRSFEVPAGTALLGGFAGGETDASQRDPQANPTILSGDNDDNDDPENTESFDDNAQCVLAVHAQNAHIPQVGPIDGFTITGGASRILTPAPLTLVFSSGPGSGVYRQFGDSGAAIRTAGQVEFRDCRVTNNSSEHADIIDVLEGSQPLFTGCTFDHNTLGEGGTLLSHTRFSHGNSYAFNDGYPDDYTNLGVVSSTIEHNTSGEPDSRIFEFTDTNLLLSDALVTANIGIESVLNLVYLDKPHSDFPASQPTISIVTSAIVANDGFAVELNNRFNPDPTNPPALEIHGATIAGNDGALVLDDVHSFISNSIITSLYDDVMDDAPDLAHPDSTLAHNTIKGFDLGLNNGANVRNNILPDFALFEDEHGPDNEPKTGDENFRLGAHSHSIDSGDSTLPHGATDLDANPRQVDDTAVANDHAVGPLPPIDRGAYERQTPSTGPLSPADINGDRETTVLDFAILAAAFGTTSTDTNHDPRADINKDHAVDILDFAIFANAWTNH